MEKYLTTRAYLIQPKNLDVYQGYMLGYFPLRKFMFWVWIWFLTSDLKNQIQPKLRKNNNKINIVYHGFKCQSVILAVNQFDSMLPGVNVIVPPVPT